MKLLLDEVLVLRAASPNPSILTAKVGRTTSVVKFWQVGSDFGRIPAKTTFWQDADPSGRPVPLGYLPEHIPPSTYQLTNSTDGCDGFDVVI